jgi:hypothetical protein
MNTIGIIFTVIGAVAAVLTGVWTMLNGIKRAARRSGMDALRLTIVEKRVDSLPCNAHADTIAELKSEVKSISRDIGKLNFKIDLFTRGATLVQHNSPLSLTEEGVRIANELKIKDKILYKWHTIKQLIEKESDSQSAYDIQQCCMALATNKLDELFAPEDIQEFKLYAFDNGNDLSYYAIVIGMMLRDEYLAAE